MANDVVRDAQPVAPVWIGLVRLSNAFEACSPAAQTEPYANSRTSLMSSSNQISPRSANQDVPSKLIQSLMFYLTLALLGLPGSAANAQTASDVETRGRVFSSCMGCDAQIYLYRNRWYDIERPGGFVGQVRPAVFDPVLHQLRGKLKWISKNVVYWDDKYHCSYDSLKGPRRPIECTSRGWVDIR